MPISAARRRLGAIAACTLLAALALPTTAGAVTPTTSASTSTGTLRLANGRTVTYHAGTRPSLSPRTAPRRHVLHPLRELDSGQREAATPRTPKLAGPRAPSQTTDSGAPDLTVHSNAGLAQSGGIEPPDPWVAAGPDNIVQMVNITMRITNRTNGAVNAIDLPDFFGLPTDPVTYDGDGRVIYDSVHNRWVATELSFDCDTTQGDATFGHGYLDLAVSRTADPNGQWDFAYVYLPDFLVDFPSLGTSTDKVGSGFNVYQMEAESSPGAGDCIDPAGFLGGGVFVRDWSDLLKMATKQAPLPGFEPTLFAPRVALQTPATAASLFVVSEDPQSGNVHYQTITGTNTAKTLDIGQDRDLTALAVVDAFGTPDPPSQSGSPSTIADAVDGRPSDAVYRSGRLTFVSTTSCTPSGDTTARDCGRFTELSGSSATTAPVLRQDILVAKSGADSYMPGAGYARDGTLHLAWTESSSSSHPSSMAAYQRTTDAIGSISTPQTTGAGTTTYQGTRWGDYVGVAQDPQVPDAVWEGNQYSGASGRWATNVVQLQEGGLRFVPITPVRILDTRTATKVGTLSRFTSGTPQTFQVTGGTIPASAKAITGNVTVVNQKASGYVSITPVATSSPTSSTINFPASDVRANNLTAALGAGGKLSAVYKAAAGKTTDLVFDVTGYYVDDATKATYTPVTPVRMLDSRPTGNVGLAGAFVANTARRLPVGGVTVNSSVPVPANAIAITANLTVVNQSKAGYLSVLTADPGSATPAVSNLNFPKGDVRANGITVPLDSDPTNPGAWIVYKASAGNTADVVLDVTGYFTADSSGAEFHPLNPGRIMDTRGVPLSGLSGKFHATTPRSLDTDGHWGVPAGASAITGNLTVVNQTKSGYISVTQTSTYPVSTSNLNFPVGDTRANGITVPLSTSPAGNAFLVYGGAAATATTDLILDLSGYFE